MNVLRILATNTQSTYDSLAVVLSLSSATTKRSLQNLKIQGYIIRQGSKKTGFWQLTEKGKALIS